MPPIMFASQQLFHQPQHPNGNGLEICDEMSRTLELFPNGCGNEDEVLPLSCTDNSLPQWLVEKWPCPAAN
jgi:hypothetical protein